MTGHDFLDLQVHFCVSMMGRMSPRKPHHHHVGDPGSVAERFVSEALPLQTDLLRAARRHTRNLQDAEDLVQETYTKAWTGFHSYTPGTNLRAWMLRIMVNTWISTHRKVQSRPPEILTDDITDAHAIAAPSTEFEVLIRAIDPDVRRAVQSLPARLQATLFYADVCELPHKEIAALTGVPVGTVMSRVHNARKRLRSALSDNIALRDTGMAA